MYQEPIGGYIVCVGNPFQGGFRLFGPFNTSDEAFEWGENSEYEDHEWNIADLFKPKGE